MGHGDETNRPHSKTVRTFKILRVSSQQCFLQVHDVQLRPFILRSRVIVYEFSVFVVAHVNPSPFCIDEFVVVF